MNKAERVNHRFEIHPFALLTTSFLRAVDKISEEIYFQCCLHSVIFLEVFVTHLNW